MSKNSAEDNLDFQLLIDFYKQLNCQGPGSEGSTQKALSFIPTLSENSKIADIGCGTGTQTLTLAQKTQGQITAVDLSPDFISCLQKRIEQQNLENRITPQIGSMENLPFSEDELDLIWAEGSIYIMGFEKGLNEWKKFLKPGGFIAVSEISWITETRPAGLEKFWNEAYPEINTISHKIRQMEKAGYKSTAHFILPENAWLENFYDPMIPLLENFLKQQNYSEAAQQFIQSQKEEIDLYKQNKEYYSYVFYIGQKI